MMDLVRLLQVFGRPWLRRAAQARIRERRRLADDLRFADERKLQHVGRKAGLTISPGITAVGGKLRIPFEHFLGHGIIAGATGSGKTRAAVVLLREIFESITETVCGIGIIDLKGEFFAHAYAKCKSSEGLHVLDLSHGAVIPYDLLMPQNGEGPNELIARRMETLRDLLDSSDTSQRMYRMLRFLLTLLVESDLSFAALDHIIETPELAVRLAAKSNNDRLKRYFRDDFLKEKSVTLPALHYRLDPLLTPESVRFSLSAGEQFDFRAAMDNGEPALINLAGAGNHASKIFQSLILSDLRQAIFTRREVNVPYLWFCDEAQLLFRRQSDKENLSTIFSLARSYGAHVTLITQSLRSAIGDSDFFENLETNFRWLLLLRSGQSDAAIIRPGLRATGLVQSTSSSGQPRYFTPEQEIQHTLKEISDLPAREAYLWIRGSGAKAVRITVNAVPETSQSSDVRTDSQLADRVRSRLKEEEKRLFSIDSNSGQRKSVEEFLAQLEEEYPPNV